MNAGSIVEHARELEGAYLDDLRSIVNMDSGTYDVEQVRSVGLELAAMFARNGCDIEWRPAPQAEVAETYIAKLRGERPGVVLLLGHHDTVYPAGTTAERRFRIDGSRAYGPVVMDMKGGVVLAVHALALLKQRFGDQHPKLVFVGNPDEEIGSPTSRSIIEEFAREADLVLVLEPGREPGSIQTTRKGVGMYELTVEGTSAHAGARPQDGRSAVLELAHKTIVLHNLNDFQTGTTVNVGVVRGGTRRNVVADRAVASIDLRASTSSEAEIAHQRILAIASDTSVEGTRSSIAGGMNRPPMEKSPGTQASIDVGRQLVWEMGLTFLETTSGGGSDGNFTAALGVPTLDGLGPVGRNAHSSDEWLDISSLAQRLALLVGLIAHAPIRTS